MHIKVPSPITIIDRHTGKPIKISRVLGDKVKTMDHGPESFHEFVLERLMPEKSTFEEQRIWTRVLDALAKAEQERRSGNSEPVAEIHDNDFIFFKVRMAALSSSGLLMRGFLPFSDAMGEAKREKPEATQPPSPAA